MVVTLPDAAYGIPLVFVFALLIYAAIAAGRKKRWKLAWAIYAVGIIQQLFSIASLAYFSSGWNDGRDSVFPGCGNMALRDLLAVWQDTGNNAVFATPGRMIAAIIFSAVVAVTGAAILIVSQQKRRKQ